MNFVPSIDAGSNFNCCSIFNFDCSLIFEGSLKPYIKLQQLLRCTHSFIPNTTLLQQLIKITTHSISLGLIVPLIFPILLSSQPKIIGVWTWKLLTFFSPFNIVEQPKKWGKGWKRYWRENIQTVNYDLLFLCKVENTLIAVSSACFTKLQL